jgi:gliding motility-associated lipoprotein GldD
MRYLGIIVFLSLLFISCDEETLPKPSAFLSLEYPPPEYRNVSLPLPFTFEKNNWADSIMSVKISRDQKVKGIDLNYPQMKGTIYITYKKIEENNLRSFLIDAQAITQKHTIKANEIIEQPYIDEENRIFGMFYEVGGDAASQSQFYVTDSLNHFVTGSLYFYAKPNYDSILPAAYYLRNDIKHVMETIRWQ